MSVIGLNNPFSTLNDSTGDGILQVPTVQRRPCFGHFEYIPDLPTNRQFAKPLQENLLALLDLHGGQIADAPLEKAEIFRQLGRFEEAIALLKSISADDHKFQTASIQHSTINRRFSILIAGGVSKIRKSGLHKIHLMADEISREPHGVR